MNNTSVVHISKDILLVSTTNGPSKAEVVLWCSVFALVSVLIVVGNLLTIALFAVNKNLRKKSLFLVINMAFADVIIGAFAVPLFIYLRLGMDYYQLYKKQINLTLSYFYITVLVASLTASLLSATSISCERFYAIYRPFKHRTLTMRTYRIVTFTVWTLTALNTCSAIFIPYRFQIYVGYPFGFTLTFIICSFNIAIWRKFQNEGVATQQQNREAQNERLAKTLLFVSILSLLCWLPMIVLYGLEMLGILIPWRWPVTAAFLNFFNSFVHPVVYALRIPEFRQALAQCCFRRRPEVN